MIKSAREWNVDRQAEFAGRFENIPFVENGATISGVDDAGLVRLFYSKLSVRLHAIDLADDKRWRQVYLPLFGDVTTFEGEGATPRMGVYVCDMRFLYAHPRLGVTLGDLDRAPHCDFVNGYFRLKKNG